MNRLILLTGATGYVGGRLLKSLERDGLPVRCLARRPEFLRSRVAPETEVVAGDLLDRASLDAALRGVDTAYYLVHSMGLGAEFEEADRAAARNFAEAARDSGLKRIIYLGGLGEDRGELSPHLRSRHEVGEILRASGVSLVEFRASIILGAGSLSFEMIRALVERLPVMITPRWVEVRAQPIQMSDVLRYLRAGLELKIEGNRVIEIGGPDQVSYGELMREYARQRGLRRWMIPVPVLTPRLSSLWLGLVTPLYARVGRKLVDSIRNPTVVNDPSGMALFDIQPKGVRDAIAGALRNEELRLAESRWSDALSSSGNPRQWGGVRFGTRIVDSRVIEVDATAGAAFAAIERIGGATGWYYGDWLWTLRGWLDLLVGGVGMRRGRRDAGSLAVGDTVDCWRVEAIEAGRRVRLFAEMKLPGRAWLEFEAQPKGPRTSIHQTAIYDPVGLAGLAYWYALYPLHELVFAGMLRGIAQQALTINSDASRHAGDLKR